MTARSELSGILFALTPVMQGGATEPVSAFKQAMQICSAVVTDCGGSR
jgi:hypothetical protein